MKNILLTLMVFGIVGCGTTGNDGKVYPGLFGQRVVGNEMYVSVSNVWNEMDALPLAEEHCKKYNKIPALSSKTNNFSRIDAKL